MTIPKLHTFDGQPMTIVEICEQLPGYSESSLRAHLAKGRNTRHLIDSFKRSYAKPSRAAKVFRYGRKIPHVMGGPPPMQPTPVT